MRILAQKSLLNGTVAIPASKSHTIRAITIASLADGQSLIHNPLDSQDAQSCVRTYRSLGAAINTENPRLWIVQGTGGKIQTPKDTIDVGNSGTTLNIAIGSAALIRPNEEITFTGDYQIQSRPVGILMQGFNSIRSKNMDCQRK